MSIAPVVRPAEGVRFEPGYPLIDRIIPYEQKIEILTGKRSAGLSH